MEMAALIFVVFMLLPGIWWIVAVNRDFKRKAAAIAREQSERAALAQSGLPGMAPRQALRRVQAIARRQIDPWKNMTPSVISTAFKSFYQDAPGQGFDSSVVSAAFEKFTEEIKRSRVSKAKS